MSAPKSNRKSKPRDPAIKDLAETAARDNERMEIGIGIREALRAAGEKPLGMDAGEWAKFWLKVVKENPEIATDEGAMIGWFANVAMSGYDEARRTFEPKDVGCANTVSMPSLPTAAEIREVIASLKTLSDTLPGIVHAANGSGLRGDPMHTMQMLERGLDMLLRHSYDVQDQETEQQRLRTDKTVQNMIDDRQTHYRNGMRDGIKQEQLRAAAERMKRAEARKNRKRK